MMIIPKYSVQMVHTCIAVVEVEAAVERAPAGDWTGKAGGAGA